MAELELYGMRSVNTAVLAAVRQYIEEGIPFWETLRRQGASLRNIRRTHPADTEYKMYAPKDTPWRIVLAVGPDGDRWEMSPVGHDHCLPPHQQVREVHVRQWGDVNEQTSWVAEEMFFARPI